MITMSLNGSEEGTVVLEDLGQLRVTFRHGSSDIA